jgi:hypothetical protein
MRILWICRMRVGEGKDLRSEGWPQSRLLMCPMRAPAPRFHLSEGCVQDFAPCIGVMWVWVGGQHVNRKAVVSNYKRLEM